MKPILFNTAMVGAILDGRKTCTRRVIKPQPPKRATIMQELSKASVWAGDWGNNADSSLRCPPYMSGDVLYVREAWHQNYDGSYSYRAGNKFESEKGWRPSIHMPKEAARIFLRVTDVRVERLQDIDEEGVCAEGAEPLIGCYYEHGVIEPDGTLGDMCYNVGACGPCPYAGKSYGEMFGETIWNATIKPADRQKYGWEANPWVWVIKFERIEKPKGQLI